MIERIRGTVKWFDPSKGYGFIQSEGEDKSHPDIFVHYSAIRGTGIRNLEDGDEVEFEVHYTDRGPQALDVVRIKKLSHREGFHLGSYFP